MNLLLRTRSFAGLLLACLLLAGCASRAEIVYLPADEGTGALETVFLGTTRALTAEGFTTDRQPGTRFARYTISVPAQREAGSIPHAENAPNPAEHFLVAGQQGYGDAASFQAALSQALSERPEGERDLIVYVHGYNNTFAQSLYRTAQMRHDYQVPGLAVHFAWPSLQNPAGYVYDSDSVLAARDEFERFLRTLTHVEARNIILMAHSMGSHLAMETLRSLSIAGDRETLQQIDGVILMSPDIDVDVFRTQAARIAPLPQPFIIFTSQRDRALRLSARISNQPERLGNIGTVDDVADFDITLIDISEFTGGDGDRLNHMAAVTSPAMVALLRRAAQVDAALQDDPSAREGLLPGTVQTVRNATQIVLDPLN